MLIRFPTFWHFVALYFSLQNFLKHMLKIAFYIVEKHLNRTELAEKLVLMNITTIFILICPATVCRERVLQTFFFFENEQIYISISRKPIKKYDIKNITSLFSSLISNDSPFLLLVVCVVLTFCMQLNAEICRT